MSRALTLAARGRYSARPNPMVGCVIVSGGDIVGEGWHERTGDAHAEVNALKPAGKAAAGATVFVTLEPCSHHGRTPPCADALIEAGVGEVIVAMTDPSDDVDGDGIRRLQAAGIVVRSGLLESQARELNHGFISRVTRHRPFVRLKLAMSLDGAVAMQSGESQWITGPEARADVQRLRAESGAIMTGIATVLADDPSLNVRDERFPVLNQPLRVVLDSSMRMPADARMLKLPGDTLVATASTVNAPEGARRLRVPGHADGVDIPAVLGELAALGVNDLLVEAGPTLAGHLLRERLFDELVIYQSPHIMGSSTTRAARTPSWTALADRLELDVVDTRVVGRDQRITARALN
ncbi:MAG: bifunctional diaminohydroxyphosphoribosylaminopyrimidine deaminase/5-amino-6-(5-phosphoribosylamino)uracil reductase RibD [Woeseiaceae bacterium]|nr:bifunctional diaminohydroxyphosphoribosylaminopyrimidine deaminase/5-amino-6-(5-phosphoribosylamino)uracil reductase RibD [Woeseiaceae bacterium]